MSERDSSRPTYDVALLRCPDYSPARLDAALREAASSAGFPAVAGKRVLVKPNLLKAAEPDKAVCTHPEFLKAALRLLKELGAASLLVGDSPAWQGGRSAARAAGLLEAAESEGAQWVDFAPGATKRSPEARLAKGFAFASVLEDCDLVLNFPKLKTHRLMKFTGAIKNLFGLVPGLGKSGFHLRYPTVADFGTMLVDLAASVPACFSLMDGIVAMEGEGPGDGEPYPLGLVLASTEPAALDWVAASCVGYEPERLPYLVDALERGGRDPKNPKLSVGPAGVAECRVGDFDLLPYGGSGSAALKAIPGFASGFMRRLLTDRPIFDPGRCEGCSACVVVCPAKALVLEKGSPNRVRIDDEACISCFCCHEVCPAHAIRVGKVPFRPRKARRGR